MIIQMGIIIDENTKLYKSKITVHLLTIFQ